MNCDIMVGQPAAGEQCCPTEQRNIKRELQQRIYGGLLRKPRNILEKCHKNYFYYMELLPAFYIQENATEATFLCSDIHLS